MKIFVLVLLVVAAVFADSCNSLNAIYEQRVSPFYRQFIQDFQIVEPNTILLVQHYDISTSPKDLKFLGTRLVSINSVDRSELTLISQAYFNTSGPLTENNLINNGTRIFSLSNAVSVSFADIQSNNAQVQQRRAVLSTLLPSENGVLSYVYFTILNATTPNPIKSIEKDVDAIKFTYPFAAGEEKVYDKDGNVVGPQTIDYKSETVQTDLNNKYQLQVRALRNIASGNDILGSFSFVALITTQGSTKLVRYTNTINPFNNNIKPAQATIAKLIVPEVTGLGNITIGGLLHTAPDNKIFVVINLHKDQLKAFNALHGLALVISDKQIQVPVLLTINPTTLVVESVVVLGSSLEDSANLFATAMDARDSNAIVIAGNTSPFSNMRSAADNQRAFVMRVNANGTLATYLDMVVTDADKKASGNDARFILKSVAVAAGSDDSSRVVVGGWVGDYVKALFLQGRVSLIDIPTKASLYNMDAGESGSNSVEIIRRQVFTDSIPETLYLGMMMDAPTVSVADYEYRNVGSGFWQVDCSPRNNVLELGVKIAFFSFFGIVTFVFTIVVGFYGFVAVKMAVEKRRSGYSNIN